MLGLGISPGALLLLSLPQEELQDNPLSRVKAILTVARKAHETLHMETATASPELWPTRPATTSNQDYGGSGYRQGLPGSQSKGTGLWRHFYCLPPLHLWTAHLLWNLSFSLTPKPPNNWRSWKQRRAKPERSTNPPSLLLQNTFQAPCGSVTSWDPRQQAAYFAKQGVPLLDNSNRQKVLLCSEPSLFPENGRTFEQGNLSSSLSPVTAWEITWEWTNSFMDSLHLSSDSIPRSNKNYVHRLFQNIASQTLEDTFTFPFLLLPSQKSRQVP